MWRLLRQDEPRDCFVATERISGEYVGEGLAAAQLAGATLADLLLGRDTERTRLAWVGPLGRSWPTECQHRPKTDPFPPVEC